MIRVVDPLPNNAIRTMANILANKEPRIRIKIPQEAIVTSEIDRSNAVMQAAYRVLPAAVKAFWKPREPINKTQETYENVLRYCFRQNDERRDGMLRRDAALDGLLYDQIALKCVDLRLTSSWNNELYGGTSPFVILRLDPTGVCVERDNYGISCALHRYVRSLREVKSVFENVKATFDLDSVKDEKNNVLFAEMYWKESDGSLKQAMWIEKIGAVYKDLEDHVSNTAWIANPDGVEIQENSLGLIPIVQKTCNGSGNNIMPILYAAEKSNFHAASNAAYTLLLSNAIKFGLPQLQKTGANPNDPPLVIDYTQPHIYNLGTNQELKAIEQPENDKQVDALRIIIDKMQESTAPKSIRGEYPTGSPASLFALSVSVGTQVIAPIRDALNQSLREIGGHIFKYLKTYPDYDKKYPNVELWMDGGKTVVEPNKIPKWMDISVEFEPQLPQDENAKMQIAMQAHQTGWLPRNKTYELAKFDDINEINDMWKEQGAPQTANPAIPAPQQLNTAYAPNVAPQPGQIDMNQQPPDQAQQMQNALMGRK